MKNRTKLLLIVMFICLIVLCFFVKKYEFLDLDSSVYNFLISFENDHLTNFFKIVTNLGGTICLVVLTIFLIIFIKQKKYPIIITINILISVTINQILKLLFSRPRPSVAHLIVEKGYSFPSGHAMASLTYYGLLIYLINISNFNKKIKIVLNIFLVFIIFLIGLTRIYLGVHYFTDVLAGYLVSFIYLIIFVNYVKSFLKDE